MNHNSVLLNMQELLLSFRGNFILNLNFKWVVYVYLSILYFKINTYLWVNSG